MDNFLKIGEVNVLPALFQLKRHPQLWDQFTERSEAYGSPHTGVSDIWVRYRDRAEFNGSWADFANEPHDCVWYAAAECLPAVKDICFDLMTTVRGERLGGVLITRVPPGGQVQPHIDGGHNAKTYDKFAVILESAPGQAMLYKDGHMAGPPGSVFWFRNDVEHWVRNDSEMDRITLIVCIQPERRALCHLPQ